MAEWEKEEQDTGREWRPIPGSIQRLTTVCRPGQGDSDLLWNSSVGVGIKDLCTPELPSYVTKPLKMLFAFSLTSVSFPRGAEFAV